MIYVITHLEKYKKIRYPDDYQLLNVGPVYNYEGKDNINHLNPYINELTGLYYMWKNCDDEYIGLNHYRRVFVNGINRNLWMSIEVAKEALKQCDIIVHKRMFVPNGTLLTSLEQELHPYENLLHKYYDLTLKKEPGMRDFWEKNIYLNPKHMFVCRKELMDKYCEWLFPIVIPLAEQFVKEDLDQCANKRLLGFYFERFFRYWLLKEDLKMCNCTVLDL